MLAAKCGRAECIVKYRSEGLFFKNPNKQSATVQTENLAKIVTKTSVDTNQKMQAGGNQKIIEN